MTYLYQVQRIERQFRVVTVINIALAVILISVFIGGTFAAIVYALNSPAEVTQMEHNGTVYECEHYSDGSMECSDINDPDIGFGQIK